MEKVYLVVYGCDNDIIEVYSSLDVAETRAKQVDYAVVVERKVLSEC